MTKVIEETALTFDDVLLVPQMSEILSRSAVDTRTKIGGLQLNIPIISANMDTVTEWKMAEAMARLGGIGIIHRFMTIEDQVRQVERVKRAENTIIRNPVKILPDITLAQAREVMAQYSISGLMVVDGSNHLVGILTRRDMLFRPDSTLVRECMTGLDALVYAQDNITPQAAKALLMERRIEKLPLVNQSGELVGLITVKDIVEQETNPNASRDVDGNLLVGAAIGTKAEDIDRCEALSRAGVDIIVIDIAHGHSRHTLNVVREIRQKYPEMIIVAGNVATYDGTLDLLKSGADVVKVGVGSGSICITRIVTGFGVPQLTAIMDSARACQDYGKGEIIADGGVRVAGDIVKALAAGAQAVMVGSLVSGTDEAPGRPVVKDGQRFKVIRGMASVSANIARKQVDKIPVTEDTFDQIVPEGVEALVPYKGAVNEIIYQMVGGLRSGLSYAGARNIRELEQNAVFVKITPAGKVESGAHDVES